MSVRRFLEAMHTLDLGLSRWDALQSSEFARERAARARERLLWITDQLQVDPIATLRVGTIIDLSAGVYEAIQNARSEPDKRSALLRTEVFIDTVTRRMETERATETEATSPEPQPERYANATLLDAPSGERLDESQPLRPKQRVRLRVDIGPLSASSHIRDPEPLPPLPFDVWIDVVVSSNDFSVGADRAHVAYDRIFLPKDGPARTGGGAEALDFELIAPARRKWARCRVNYYFRNALLQSHRLTAAIGRDGGFRMETDFSALRSFRNVTAVPKRERVSLLTNYSGDNRHEFVLRARGAGGAITARTFLPQPVDPVVKQIRKVLRDRAPTKRVRDPVSFRNDLEALARLGWQLYAGVWVQHSDMLADARERPEEIVIQINQPRDARFTLPWGLLYELQLESEAPLDHCPLIDDSAKLRQVAASGARACPHEHERNVLCPFGFWGFRYSIEQICSSDKVTTEINPSNNCEVLFAKTTRISQPDALQAHLTNLAGLIKGRFNHAQVTTASTRAEVEAIIDRDLPLIYFYCHGARTPDNGAQVALAIGDNELLASIDIFGWIERWFFKRRKKVWDKVRPLIFINACHSAEMTSDSLSSYLDVLVGRGGAAGLIGTEVRVNEALARDFAAAFFARLIAGNESVDAAMRHARLDFLADRNLFGLVYTPYCWADLRFA